MPEETILMTAAHSDSSPRRFHVWIVECPDWRPRHWSDVPPRGAVVDLADQRAMTDREAAAFLEGYNGAQLTGETAASQQFWAVAREIVVRYDGDFSPGETVLLAK
jgi:hypothetical protein